MKKKLAIISGISGQDGYYLSHLLLKNNYNVIGLHRQYQPEKNVIINELDSLGVNFYYFDFSFKDWQKDLEEILLNEPVDEFYNLAAQSSVFNSDSIPFETYSYNLYPVCLILETIRKNNLKTKFLQASSTEIFGDSKDPDGYKREDTICNPISPYGISKYFSYLISKDYRKRYDMFICNAISGNHESIYRKDDFLTTKIIKTAIRISNGSKEKLLVGNLDSKRDWGHSKDYVNAFYSIMQQEIPDDYIISTMKTNSVEYIINYVFEKLNLNYKNHIVEKDELKRKNEQKEVLLDSSKIRNKLKWKSTLSIEQTLDEMIEYWKNKNE